MREQLRKQMLEKTELDIGYLIDSLGFEGLLNGEMHYLKLETDNKGWIAGKIDDDGYGFVASASRWSRGEVIRLSHREKPREKPRYRASPRELKLAAKMKRVRAFCEERGHDKGFEGFLYIAARHLDDNDLPDKIKPDLLWTIKNSQYEKSRLSQTL